MIVDVFINDFVFDSRSFLFVVFVCDFRLMEQDLFLTGLCMEAIDQGRHTDNEVFFSLCLCFKQECFLVLNLVDKNIHQMTNLQLMCKCPGFPT